MTTDIPTAKPRRRFPGKISPEGRARIAQAQRERWAKKKAAAAPKVDAAPVPAPVQTVSSPRLSAGRAEQQRLLREYHEGVARREREEAEKLAAPAAAHETRSRFSHSAAPINPMRLPAEDGPPPKGFDPERPAKPEARFMASFGWPERNRTGSKPPTGVNLAPRRRVAG